MKDEIGSEKESGGTERNLKTGISKCEENGAEGRNVSAARDEAEAME